MQKAGEPENDAGFLKHIYSQLNCSCYSYPFIRLHIYGISKWLLTHKLVRIYSNSAFERAHTYTSYVLYAYLYCVYALVGGVISIRD